MELELLRAFVAFCEHLNFTRAAEAMHLSQPAMHARVRRLSEGLGAVLYVREGKALVLTPHGREVEQFARETLRRAEGLQARLAGRAPQAPVVLAAGEGAYLYVLGPALGAFQASGRAPLRLVTASAEGTVEAVRAGRAQLGVASLDAAPEGLVSEPLGVWQPVAIMTRGHRLAGAAGAPLGLEALDGEALIVPPPGRPHREAVAGALARVGARWTVAVEASGWPLLLRFAELGLGVALVNGICPPPPGCVARPVVGLPSRAYALLRRPTMDDGAALALADAITACVEGAPLG